MRRKASLGGGLVVDPGDGLGGWVCSWGFWHKGRLGGNGELHGWVNEVKRNG